MSKLQGFLDELTDDELANFYYYRYMQFLPGSKEKIDRELVKRNMDKTNLSAYLLPEDAVYRPVPEINQCPRCYSFKFYYSTEIETITYYYASVDLEVDYRTCLVCLYKQGGAEDQEHHRFTGPIGFIRTLINRKK